MPTVSTTPVSFGGLESGLDTSEIISAEMAIYEEPLDSLESQQTSLNTQISDYQTLNSQMLSLQQAADALATPASYDEAFSASSSNAAVASGTITGGTSVGSTTFTVDQLATSSTQISSGTVAATDDVVASGNLLVASGGAALGLESVAGASGLSVGAHTIAVTQASAGATQAGENALGATTITSSNDELDVTVNGTAQVLTIANGTYSAAQLAQAVASASGGTLTATLNANGELSLATTQEGSSASLQVTGGSALSTLGLSAGAATTGVDGIIDVDGTSTTVSDIAGNGTTALTLDSGTGGSITATIAGGLSVGTMTAQNVSVGDGSLSSVVAAINGANVGLTATALQVGADEYALEVSSQSTGLVGASSLDAGSFSSSSLGTLETTTAAQDAQITVGGSGGYVLTSSTNSMTGLLPGLTVNLASTSSTPVTLAISPDGSQIAGQVASLVSAANQVLSTISADTAYNSSTKTAGPLNGNTALEHLAQQVLAIVGDAVGTSLTGSDGTAGESAGLAITSSGTITFDQSAFEAAYNKDPSAVQAMFTEGGTFSPSAPAYDGEVGVAGATNDTAPGSYAVAISQSAAQAIDTGSAAFASSSSTLASAETYTIGVGGDSASYAITPGESVADVVNGLNGALAAAGLGVSAALVDTAGTEQVELISAGYGSAASFDVSTTGPDQLGLTTAGATYTGVDVEGTINGVPATGAGQQLTLEDPGNAADGLSLSVTTPGISTSTALGTVVYAPGLAQGLANLAEQDGVSTNGLINETIDSLNGTLKNVTSQIALQQQIVNTQQATLTTEFTHMEEMMANLKSESSYLSEQSSVSSSSSGLSSLSDGSSSGSSSSAGSSSGS